MISGGSAGAEQASDVVKEENGDGEGTSGDMLCWLDWSQSA